MLTVATTLFAVVWFYLYFIFFSVGHKGKFGHEFIEFEVRDNGELRYFNNSRYKSERIIRKMAYVTPTVVNELRRIVEESDILSCDDSKWPLPDSVGRQELEIVDGDDHIAFATTKIGSLLDVEHSQDPAGLRTLYYLAQDLKCFIISLISLNFKIKPI